MNILYIAPERRSAQAAASALHRLSQNVTLTWAQTPAAALGWLRDNRNALAVIVDAELQNAAGNAFPEQVRRLGVATPIAVIAPEHLERLLAAATASLDAILEQERHTKGIVEARLNRICTVLQDRVLELEAANRTLSEAHLAQTAARKTLEQRLAAAEASSREVDQKHAAEVAALSARLRDRDTEHDASLTRTNRICTVLQERLLELEATIRSADERHAADVATTDRLASRESELAAAVALRASELAVAVERCAALERQLTEQTSARSLANERFAAAEIARQRAEARHAMRMASLNSDLADLKARHDAVVSQNAAAERHLRETSASLEEAGARIAELMATSERLASREAELNAALADAIAASAIVEQQLTDAVAAHEQAHQDWASERAAAAGHLARRESELGTAFAAEAAARIAVERRLADAERAHQHTQQQAAADLTAAAERHAALEGRLRAEIDARAMLAEQLAAADQSRQQADADHARVVESLTTQLADVQAQHDRALERATLVERRLADAENAHQRTQQQAAADLTAAAARYADLEGRLRAAIDARAMLADQLAAADRARQQADADHARAVESLTTQLADLQTQHDHAREHSASLERQLTDAVTAHQHAQRQAEANLAAAAEQHAALDVQLRAEIDARAMLADQLSAAVRASQQADADHARAVESLTTQLADLQARHDHALEQITSAERQLTDVVATHHQAYQTWESERTAAADQLARRETELSTALAEEVAARIAVEQTLVDAESAHQRTQQQAEADLAAAAKRHADLENRLSAADRARQQAGADHARAVESLTTQLGDLQSRHDRALEQITSAEQQLTDVVATHHQAYQNWESERTEAAEQLARRERDLGAALAEEVAARLAVEHSLADAESARKRQQWQASSDLAAAAQRHAVLEARLAQADTVHATLEERLAAAQIDRRDADQRHAGELTELRGRLANLQALHDATVTARGHDIAQLQQERDGFRRQLNVMRTHAAALRNEADRVAGLQLQLAESQKEIRRQFERAPYGLFECNRNGAITRVNNVLARLLGYRASLDAPREDFVTAVFECAGDLQWLLERAEPAGSVQSVETTLKTRDRRRLFVRLHALTTGKAILVAVEDLTKLSTLEQRVREAHRLEAVGRVASEVAVTCDTLLRDVTRGGQLWLAGFESDTSLRQQGELLLGDVTRAAGLLRQFADYGHTQITNVEPVNMQRVLQDMKPVLERVLGDDIELTLPKTTRAFGAFDIDVEASRVERILVNVANYARERMPQGGHVRIQLATTIVDQRFLASHPKVRPGAHVVITISEVQGATRPTLPIQWPTADPYGRAALSPMEKPGMDLGPLMALIGDLGGHLWMSVEPAGNVTLQIHLPKRTQDEVMEPAARRPLTARRRQLAKWFRH